MGLKKIVIILFLSALFLDFGGVVTLFKIEQTRIRREIKRQIKRGLRSEDLHVLEFLPEDIKELEWIKANEFRYKGQLYDIVKAENCGKWKIYWCINDIQEQQLFSKLDEWVKKKSDQENAGKSFAGKLFKFLMLYYPTETAPELLIRPPVAKQIWCNKLPIKGMSGEPDSPPPQLHYLHS